MSEETTKKEAAEETPAEKKARIAAEKAAEREKKKKEREEKKAKAEAEKAERKRIREEKKAEKERIAAEKKANKKPGVIQSILNFISVSKEPVTKKEILDHLDELFPDRDRDAMAKTVNAQVGGRTQPSRMEKEKKVKFKVDIVEETKERTYSLEAAEYEW